MSHPNLLGLQNACVVALTAAAFACGKGGDDDGSTAGSAGIARAASGNAGQSNAGAGNGGGALSASDGSTNGLGGYDNSDGAAITCDNADAVATSFVEANQACSTAADCVEADAGCYSQQQDCCVVYLNRDYDQAAWSALMSQLGSCNEGCGCCAAIPAPPGCSAGQCGPNRG
jgi:hypothetical protein